MAEQLGALLDRDSHFELEKLDNVPQGKQEDGLPADIELLQTFDLNTQKVPLYLERVKEGGIEVWLVSADSVLRIPELAHLAEGPAIEKKLPRTLVEITFVGTALWVWLTLLTAALLISVLSRLLSKLVISVLRLIFQRLSKAPLSTRLESFTEPIRLLVSIAVFRACMEATSPSALLRDYLLKMLAVLVVFGIAALVMRVVDVITDRVTSRLDPRQRALSYSILMLGVRFTKICIFCFGILVVLAEWGYNTSTILAGLGVGGLAIALAAQKTIENLFGGVAVISDRPVLVGDFCQFGGQVGTIEDIGLRSTRIRTLDRTVVTIPNSQFSTMTLENYSRRDRMWFHPTLNLRRGTSSDDIRKVMAAVTKILQDHPDVDPTDVPIRFNRITLQSFDLDVFAYVNTADYNVYLRVQSELLLRILEAVAALKVVFAVPVLESLVTATEGEADKNFRTLLSSRVPEMHPVGASRLGDRKS